MSSLCTAARVTCVPKASAGTSDRTTDRNTLVSKPNVSAHGVRLVGAATHGGHSMRRGDSTVTHARKGMLADTLDGDESAKKKKKDKKAAKSGGGSDSMAGSLEPAFAGAAGSKKSSNNKNWLTVANITADFKEKPIKLLDLANGNFLAVKWESQVFVCDCNSTAYQFPLIDGEIFFGPAGPAIRVPLDGTEYDLTTGEVITWCPKNNPIRSALGTLKGTVDPIPLPVYPVKVEADGSILTNFVDKVDAKKGFSNDAAGSTEGGKGLEIAKLKEEAGGGREQSPATSSSNAPSDDASAVSPAIAVGLALVAAAAAFLVLNPSQ